MLGLPGKQLTEPALSLDGHDRQVAGRLLHAGTDAQQIADAHRAAGANYLQGGGEPLRIQLHPLATDAHQGRLQLGKLREFGRTHGLAADREVVSVLGDGVMPEGASFAGYSAGLARCLRREPEPEAGCGPGPPRGQQHAEPGRRQQRRHVAQEPVRIPDVERQLAGARSAQRDLQLRVQAACTTQLGEECLLRRIQIPRQRAQRTSRAPHCRRVDHQARLVNRLQRELHSPSVLVVTERFNQPEARAHGAADGIALPRRQRLGQPGHGLRGRREAALPAS